MYRVFGDESYAAADGSGFYVIAAVAVEPILVDIARQHILEVSPRGRRIHFSKEHKQARMALVSHMARGPWLIEVVATRALPQQQERARRRCLVALLSNLRGLDVLELESRGRRADERDVRLRKSIVGYQGVVPVRHVLPDREPLLWAADVIAGTCSRELLHGDPLTFPCTVLD